jgi:hypothetical protein
MAATSATPTDSADRPFIDVLATSTIAPASPHLFSGFLEHLGRCIYGGILPASPTTFPYTPRKPCPQGEFVATPPELLTPQGFRKDVLTVLRDELGVPLVRWPGGNYVSSYHWQDGIGPKASRVRRPELAWGGEESNEFGTDECAEALLHVVMTSRSTLTHVHALSSDSLNGVVRPRLNRILCSIWVPERSRKRSAGSNIVMVPVIRVSPPSVSWLEPFSC